MKLKSIKINYEIFKINQHFSKEFQPEKKSANLSASKSKSSSSSSNNTINNANDACDEARRLLVNENVSVNMNNVFQRAMSIAKKQNRNLKFLPFIKATYTYSSLKKLKHLLSQINTIVFATANSG